MIAASPNAGHHGCGKLYWGETKKDSNGCRTADTYNHYYTVFHTPSEHTIDEVGITLLQHRHFHIDAQQRFPTLGPVPYGDASVPLQWWVVGILGM